MNDDFILDWNDEIQPEEFSPSDWIFPIIGKTKETTIVLETATGFYINNDGYFITAGHVLKNKELDFYAVIEEVEHSFLIIHEEHLEINDQKDICLDLAICKLNLQVKMENKFCIDAPSVKMVSVSGYKRNPQSRISIQPIKQAGLYFHTYSLEKGLSNIDLKQKYSKDIRYSCSNTNSLKLSDGVKFDGLSGGPVYLGKHIYGMLIGSEYICADYILSKLEEFGIKINLQISK